jgi:hypothetical protein
MAWPAFDDHPGFPVASQLFAFAKDHVYAVSDLTYPATEEPREGSGLTRFSCLFNPPVGPASWLREPVGRNWSIGRKWGNSPTRKDSLLLTELETDLELAFSDDDDEDDWDDDDWDDDDDDDDHDDDDDDYDDDDDDRYSDDDDDTEWSDDTFDDDWTDETPEIPEGIIADEDDDDEEEEGDDWDKKED